MNTVTAESIATSVFRIAVPETISDRDGVSRGPMKVS